MNQEKIEISSVEATSYWWIERIKNKVREIVINGMRDKKENKFASIFYNYTEKEWRNLYLELINYITVYVNDYVRKYEEDDFSQDTDKGEHDLINKALSKIINKTIPDIRLANNNSKDSVIYTNMLESKVWYKSCGVSKLSTKYEASYILTGNEDELDFYNLFLSTIFVLDKIDGSGKSVSLLRDGFCSEYIRRNDIDEDLEDVSKKFKCAFSKANDKGIIIGKHYDKTYFCSFHDIDLVGLEPYMDLALEYVKVILQDNKDINDVYTKKLINN